MDETDAPAGLSAPRRTPEIDADRLGAFLRRTVPGFAGPFSTRPFTRGQSNPTYLVEAASGRYVLRRKPPGKLLPSAHAVDREYRVMTALAGTDVPVPRTFVLCEDEAVIGSAFYVMEYLDGRIFWDPTLPELERAERAAVYDSMNAVLASLHSVDYRRVGLEDFSKPGGYMARQIARWTKQYRASETERIEAMDDLIEWLPRHLPANEEVSIVHGDYRLDNLVFHAAEPRIIGVLDWELSTIGDPFADFAYHCLTFRLTPDVFRGIAGCDRDGLGLPDEADYVAAYCRRTRRAGLPNWSFYLAYNFFRLAAILQGIVGRVRDGTAVDPRSRDLIESVRSIAELGRTETSRL
jgi:aminoglycoside phosphotransferase (APT) family kinase protein